MTMKGYAKLPCDECNGSGKVPKIPGDIFLAMIGLKEIEYVTCPKCKGDGFVALELVLWEE